MTRDFKGIWIPAEVWLDERLNALDKMILAEIDSLDTPERGCYASNQYIADFCQCSVTKVSTAVSKLTDLGYLRAENFDGRTRILKVCLTEFERQPHKIRKADSQELKDINIDSNININKEREKRARFNPPTVEDVKAYCAETGTDIDPQRFVDYYTSNGWRVGRNPMKDWKAAVRSWARRDGKTGTAGVKLGTDEGDLDGIL